MSRVFISIVLIAIGFGSFLVVQATKTGTSRVYTPHELVTQGSGATLHRIRVGGTVADAPIDYQVEPEIHLAFTLQDREQPAARIPVEYTSIKPDMFAHGRDVIIDGEFRDGTLYAASLLTQCPSKYEPPSPTEAHKQ